MNKKVHLAIFDFDGTSISRSSSVYLCHQLTWDSKWSIPTIFKVINWGIRYKFHLSHDEVGIRGIVFECFSNMSTEETDEYLNRFYQRKLRCSVRQDAVRAMEKHKQNGDTVVLLSASWQQITRAAREDLPYDYHVSVSMKIKDGRYTSEIDGYPIEGERKVQALSDFANKTFGEGNWEASYAYADHYSDISILSLAKTAFAVTPDSSLKRHAKKVGMKILNWQ